MTDTHTEALVERVARAIAGELGKQDFGEPFELKDDLKVAYLDQGEVDFGLVARAAIEALPARNDERALKLVEAVRPFAEACDECVDDRDGDQVSIWEHGAAMQIEFRHLRAARNAYQAALADTQPSGETR
jgi:hypothetical protein